MKTIIIIFAAFAAFVLWLRRQTVIDLKMQKGFRSIEELMLRSSSTQEAEDCHRQLQDLQEQLDQVAREAEAYRVQLKECEAEAKLWKALAEDQARRQGAIPAENTATFAGSFDKDAEQTESSGGSEDSQRFEEEAEAYARFKAMTRNV